MFFAYRASEIATFTDAADAASTIGMVFNFIEWVRIGCVDCL